MGDLRELVCNTEADASLAFRERVYRRAEQGELLRDLVSLANASVVGRRFLFLGVDDRTEPRRFPGIAARSWASFCAALPRFIASAVEPGLKVTLQSLTVDEALVGAVCLEACEDPPYLLSRRVSATMPAGIGWIRRGTNAQRLLRRHLQRIFAARYERDEAGDVTVGFPGALPRAEIELPVLPLDSLPSTAAAHRVERMLRARRDSKAVLGRTDSRIARLVQAQLDGASAPFQERGTQTLRVLLDKVPVEQAAADDHYRFELRAHRLNLVLGNLSDKAQTDLVLTLSFPRIEGFDIARHVCAAPGAYNPRHRLYPKVDHGPQTIAVQVSGLRIPRRGTIDAFFEPLRVMLREPLAGRTIRVVYRLQGPTLSRSQRGRLKILVTA